MPIPRHIVQFWDKPTIPEAVQDTMRSWRQQCPGYRFSVFNDQSARQFIEENHGAELALAFTRCQHPAMRADVFRLAYLSRHGGVYVDVDDYCRADITPWLEEGQPSLLLYLEILGAVGNDMMAAAPGHPVIRAAFSAVSERILKQAGSSIWFVSGPGALSDAFCRHYAADFEQGLAPAGVRLLNQGEFRKRVCFHIHHAYKMGDGNWTAMRVNEQSLYAAAPLVPSSEDSARGESAVGVSPCV